MKTIIAVKQSGKEQIMRMINADALRHWIESECKSPSTPRSEAAFGKRILMHMEVMGHEDVQPVVRCSECANNYSTPHNPMCDYMDATLYPDSFCSKGKRKGVDCTDCIKNGGDWECDHIHCHKGVG